MTDDESQIRALIGRWAEAVHAGDLDVVLADHAADIVMFDVPPPNDGVRGIDAYRRPGRRSSNGNDEERRSRSSSLDVTAGREVAFAHALLRCGTAEELERTRRTGCDYIGLRKDGDRWIVPHEHHSFPVAVGTETATAYRRHG